MWETELYHILNFFPHPLWAFALLYFLLKGRKP